MSSALDPILTDVAVEPVKGIAQVVNGEDRPYQWNVFSPRIGLTWDVTGDGKTVAKLALSQYGDIMGVGWYTATPYGTGGTMNYWWQRRQRRQEDGPDRDVLGLFVALPLGQRPSPPETLAGTSPTRSSTPTAV